MKNVATLSYVLEWIKAVEYLKKQKEKEKSSIENTKPRENKCS